MALKVVSFDLDDTLADKNFDDALWHREIPKLYAAKRGLPFEEALAFCEAAYDAESDKSIHWYDINYWLGEFGLVGEKQKLIAELRPLVRLFPDALPCLARLEAAGCRLAIVSNATREFMAFKLEADGLGSHFGDVFSMTSDFKIVKKDAAAFLGICGRLNAQPSQVWHVGDHYKFDYEVPRSVGINAFYLDRKKEKKGEFVVHDLNEFADRVLGC